MKKAISLLLVLMLCLSLWACGSGDQNNKIPNEASAEVTEETGNELILCQEWKAVSSGQVISFDEDGNFYINGQTYPYEYDEESSKIIVDVGVQVSLPVSLVDNIYRIDVEGTEFAPAGEYENLHAEYAKTMMVVPGFDGTPALNAALVSEHLDRVELTVDNWREYLKVYSYDVEVVEKDAFGEITKSEKSTVFRLGHGTERYHCVDSTIELQHKETGEISTYGNMGLEYVLRSSIDLDEYECTRIKGYLYFIDYPDEVMEEVLNVFDRWSVTSENAEIQVTSSSFEGTWRVDCEAKTIENASGSWSDYFE